MVLVAEHIPISATLATSSLSPRVNGVLVEFAAGIDDIRVVEIEAAINVSSSLASVTSADTSPTKTVDGEMDGVTSVGSFSGGA